MISFFRVPALIFLLSMAICAPRAAWAANTIVSPTVEQSVLTLTWRGDATIDDKNKAQDGAWKQRVLVGYGFTDRLYIAAAGLDERGGGQTPSFDGVELLAKYEITPQGEYWLDSGVLIDYKRNIVSGPDNVSAKLLLAKKTGNFLNVANIIVQRDMGNGAGRSINTGLLLGTRYVYTDALQPGFEFQNTFGTIDRSLSFTSNSDQAGPVLYGKFGGGFNYEVGYLFGVSRRSPQGDAKALLGYSFKF